MSFDIMNCLKSGAELPKEVVNYMYGTGAFLIIQDFPEGHEFGIDYKSWNVGEKFMGLKMIPPGVHFVYVSVKGAPRIGFFHNFESREVLVKKWDRSTEDFSETTATAEQIERFRSNLRNMDSCLGPYPYETYRMWYSLTDFITPATVQRLNPEKGRITAQAELISMETEMMENAQMNAGVGCSNSVDREHPRRTRFVDQSGLPIMKIRDGYQIRFKEIPQLACGGSRAGIDHTDRLEALISSLSGDWKQLVAEVQFAFACFLVGQVFEGFEQWKRLIHLMCTCPGAFSSRQELFLSFVRVLFFQLKECPTDFFVDIVSKDNFLTTTLSMLFANIRDSELASADLKKKSLQFKAYLVKQFKWDFECDD